MLQVLQVTLYYMSDCWAIYINTSYFMSLFYALQVKS